MADILDNFYIYIYLDPTKSNKYIYNEYKFNYEPFYVGKGKNRRCYDIKKGRSKYFKNKINKIKRFGYEPIIIKLYDNISEKKAFELETKLINKIGRKNNSTGPLLNIIDKNRGINGYKHSKKILDKIKMNFFNIQKKFEEKHCILLTDESKYKNCYTKLDYICSNGHKNSISWNHFQQNRNCSICSNNLKSEKTKGENGYNSILITQDVIQIKLLLKDKKLIQKEISNIFEISRQAITAIKNKKSWSHIEI